MSASARSYEERTALFAHHMNGPYVQFLKRWHLDIDVVRAEGALVKDSSGKSYIDCIAGYGNCLLGHKHPAVVAAVAAELGSARPYNLPFIHDVQVELAAELSRLTANRLECSFFVNSGSEAVETALKLARLVTGKPGVISMRGAWHGFTLGCMSISEPAMTKSFLPLVDHVRHVPFGDVAAVRDSIDDKVGCVIVEPVQAESGAVVPPRGYLKELERICAERRVLLLFDEVKSGIAKTGKMFACEHDDALPDILILGKALGGGVVPIGGVVAKRSIWSKFGFSFPMASSSGAGNALACSAALATLRLVASDGLVEQSADKGNQLREALQAIQGEFPAMVREVSGLGLLLSMRLPDPRIASEVVGRCAQAGVLIMNAFCDRTKILVEPPVVISAEQIRAVANAIRSAVNELAQPRS
jgi:putrescine aminotransferase